MQGLWQCEHCVNYPVRRVEVFFLCLFSIQVLILSTSARLQPVFTATLDLTRSSASHSELPTLIQRGCLHVSFADVFVAKKRPSCQSFALRQLSINRVGLLEGARGQWPSQRRSLRSERRYWIVGSFAVSRTSWLVILSFQVISRNLRRNLTWSVFSLASCLVYVGHVSLQYNRVLRTQT